MAKSKLEEALEKYLSSGSNLELRAGVLEGSTYDDGTSVAQVAYMQEFGASINQAERTGTVYRSIRKDGTFNKNGRFVKAKNSNFATEHNIPAHTINIPPRPFFRTVIANGKTTWSAILAKGIENQGSVRGGMEYLGGAIVEELHTSVMTWTSPPNAASTVAKKGSNSPLRDSMRLSRSFAYEVIDDQS